MHLSPASLWLAGMQDVDLNQLMHSWQRSWRTALDAAGLKYRWHDLRHTFVSRLAENPAVPEETIRALAGHVSQHMLRRYSHISTPAGAMQLRPWPALSQIRPHFR